MSHADAVAWWKFAEDMFFLSTVTGLCLICAEELRWRWYGIALALGTWMVWVAAYDVAEGFRNVNQ